MKKWKTMSSTRLSEITGNVAWGALMATDASLDYGKGLDQGADLT
jgi:hypothetical protein